MELVNVQRSAVRAGRHKAARSSGTLARIPARALVALAVVLGLLAVGAPTALAKGQPSPAPSTVTVPGCAGTTSDTSGSMTNPTPAGGFVLTGAQYDDYVAGKAVPLYYSTGARIANADGTYTEHAGWVPFCGAQKTDAGAVSVWRFCTDEAKVNCLSNPPSRMTAPNPKFDNNQAALSVIAYLLNTRDQSTKRARALLQTQIWCLSENLAPGSADTDAKNYFNNGQFNGTAAGGTESAPITDAEVTCDPQSERDKAIDAVPASATLELTATPASVNVGETATFDLGTNFAVGNVKLQFVGASSWNICPGAANGATLNGDVLTLRNTGHVLLCATRADAGTLTLKATGHALDRNSLNWFHNNDSGCQAYTSVADYQTLTTKQADVAVDAPAPAPTEPAPTTPAPTEPAPTTPAPTEPAPTEPAPTEPAPTEPAPTTPAPTTPAPTTGNGGATAPSEPTPTTGNGGATAPSAPTPSTGSGNGEASAPGAGSGAVAPAGAARPTVRTVASVQHTGVGSKIHDTVFVSGLPAGVSVTATAQLFGPKGSEGAITCTDAAYATVTFQVTGNGTFTTPSVTVNAPGWYSWQVTLAAGPSSQSATEGCAQSDETTLVSRPVVAAPVIPTGFYGVVDGPIARLLNRPAGDSLSIARLHIRADLKSVGVKGKTLSVPAKVSNVGWYGRTAHFGDVIGSAVIAGHVSDRHDSPGALNKLSKVRNGDVIVVKRGGVTYRYKVVAKHTYSRAKGLPQSLFSTTGRAELQLVTCAGRRVKNGHFHYTQNLVVTAVPIS